MSDRSDQRKFRARRVAPGQDAHAWRQAIAEFDPARAAVLKQDGATAVWRARMLGRDVVVKRWDLRAGARWKSMVHAWRGDRHWRGAERLARHGIPTAPPLALVMEHSRAGRAQWLVMEWLDGRTVLDLLAAGDLPPREQHRVAAAVGEVVARLAAAGLVNRDGKPSNLVVTTAGAAPRVAVIDCVGLRRAGDRGRALVRMLAALYIEPLGCGCPPRRSLVLGAIGAATAARGPDAIAALWRAASDQVERHGDPRPRVNPLSPAHGG